MRPGTMARGCRRVRKTAGPGQLPAGGATVGFGAHAVRKSTPAPDPREFAREIHLTGDVQRESVVHAPEFAVVPGSNGGTL